MWKNTNVIFVLFDCLYASAATEGVFNVTFVHPYVHAYVQNFSLRTLTLVCLNQMLWNWYAMLITTIHWPRFNFGYLRPWTMSFYDLRLSRDIICVSLTHSQFIIKIENVYKKIRKTENNQLTILHDTILSIIHQELSPSVLYNSFKPSFFFACLVDFFIWFYY